jgi:hypothetical protein
MDPRCRTSALRVGASRWSDSSTSRHELMTRKGTTSGKTSISGVARHGERGERASIE